MCYYFVCVAKVKSWTSRFLSAVLRTRVMTATLLPSVKRHLLYLLGKLLQYNIL